MTNLSDSDLPSFAGKFLMIIAIKHQREEHGRKLRKKQVICGYSLAFGVCAKDCFIPKI